MTGSEAFETMKRERLGEARTAIAGRSRNAADTINRALSLFGSHDRPAQFLSLFQGAAAAPELFWQALHIQWEMFDAIDHDAFGALLRRYQPQWRAEFLEPEDAAFYSGLPVEFVAYRGQDKAAPVGLSWTLDQAIARGFARGHRGIQHRAPVIYEARIRKVEIAGAYAGRGEREIVTFSPPSIDRIDGKA